MLQIRHIVLQIINALRILPFCRLIEHNRRIECREIRLHLHRVCRRKCRGKARHGNRKDHRQNHHGKEGREQGKTTLAARPPSICDRQFHRTHRPFAMGYTKLRHTSITITRGCIRSSSAFCSAAANSSCVDTRTALMPKLSAYFT